MREMRRRRRLVFPFFPFLHLSSSSVDSHSRLMQAYDQDYYLDHLSSYPLESLDESGVDSLFSHLGYPYYSSNLLEHGITGSVLIHLDHTALKDVGVHSVGQRLNILKTVYVLKVLSNIKIEEGHYVPPSEELQDGVMPSSQIIALLTERGQFIAISSPFFSHFDSHILARMHR